MPTTILSGKHFRLTPALKKYLEEKLAKIAELSGKITELKVELDRDMNQRTGEVYRAEISAILPGKVLKAGHKAEHMQEAIDLCLPKLVRQLKKYKTKLTKNRQPGAKTIRK